MHVWQNEPWATDVARVAARPIARIAPLHGGMIGEVYRVDFADGATAVAKVDRRAKPELAIEGMMLRYLADHTRLPVPRLWHVDPTLLLMDYVPGSSSFDAAAEAHLAELLVDLHRVHADACGFAQDTLIGLLRRVGAGRTFQPCAWRVSPPLPPNRT